MKIELWKSKHGLSITVNDNTCYCERNIEEYKQFNNLFKLFEKTPKLHQSIVINNREEFLSDFLSGNALETIQENLKYSENMAKTLGFYNINNK